MSTSHPAVSRFQGPSKCRPNLCSFSETTIDGIASRNPITAVTKQPMAGARSGSAGLCGSGSIVADSLGA